MGWSLAFSGGTATPHMKCDIIPDLCRIEKNPQTTLVPRPKYTWHHMKESIFGPGTLSLITYIIILLIPSIVLIPLYDWMEAPIPPVNSVIQKHLGM